jgi:hypothetical protein
MWDDQRFRALSKPPPNAQTLWQRLLTGPELGCIPGLFSAREGGLADALGWPVEAFRECWKEIAGQDMAEADWKVGIVWLPNALQHNGPTSPNQVAAWRKAANELPECPLRRKAMAHIARMLTDKGPAWIAPWRLAADADWAPEKIRKGTRDMVRERDGSFCRYCALPVNWSDRKGPSGATYDHVDPTKRATPDNIVVSCRACNSQKGFRTPAEAGMVLIQIGSRSELLNNLGTGRNHTQTQTQESGSRSDPAAAPTLADRARDVLENPHDGQWQNPSRWPEVVAIAKAWSEPFGIKDPKLRDFPDGDRDLKAILLAIADGYGVEELVSLGAKAAADPWFKGLNKPGPSTFSAAVIRRLLADREAIAKAEPDDAAGWA